MRRIVILFLLGITQNLIAFSQSNIRINNYWENTYYINPASMISEYQYVASLAAREQWISFPGAPQTEYFTFTSKLYTNKTHSTQIGQLGIKIFHDKIGYTNLFHLSPSYSYSVRLNMKWLLNLGAAYKIRSTSYDLSKATTQNVGDPVLNTTQTNWSNHNADIGFEIISYSMLIGFSSQNFLSLFIDADNYQTNANFLYAIFKTELDETFNLLSGVSFINNHNLFQTEIKLSLVTSSRHFPNFEVGAFYRTTKEFGVLFGVDIVNNLRLAFSYDYNVSGIIHSSYGTPEALLIWKLGKIRNCECEDLFR